MRRIKKFAAIAALVITMTALSGCAYCNNKSWDDMTAQEKEEVRQNFEEETQELKEEFSGSAAEEEYVSFILDSVGQFLENTD